MLRFGYFDDFVHGDDALLIWGDAVGLNHLEKLFRRLAAQTEQHVSLNQAGWAAPRGALTVALEVKPGSAGALEVSGAAELAALVVCSPEQFANFADKVAVLAAPDCTNGHHYLDAPGISDQQIIVSKGEYPPDFGDASR